MPLHSEPDVALRCTTRHNFYLYKNTCLPRYTQENKRNDNLHVYSDNFVHIHFDHLYTRYHLKRKKSE